jgi:hypothetical protein
MLIGGLIITAEIIILIWLMLPRILACGQAKYDAFYGATDADPTRVDDPRLPAAFHDIREY